MTQNSIATFYQIVSKIPHYAAIKHNAAIKYPCLSLTKQESHQKTGTELKSPLALHIYSIQSFVLTPDCC